jgi:hypothetical protein
MYASENEKAKCRGVWKYFKIELAFDEKGEKVTEIYWKQNPMSGALLTNLGVFFLRTNKASWDCHH